MMKTGSHSEECLSCRGAGRFDPETAPQYSVRRLRSLADLRSIFPEGKADQMNWCLLSTSGVHGDYGTLDDLEPGEAITVLVINPRIVGLRYGHFAPEPEDVPWLRALVRSSLEEMAASQDGNLPA
jgi:hypothetical protein